MLALMIFVHGDTCDAVSPLAWAGPEGGTNSKDPVRRPAKKQATQSFIHKDAV